MPTNNEIQPRAVFDAKAVEPYYAVSDSNLVTNHLVREIALELSTKEGQLLDVGCGCGTFYSLLGKDTRIQYLGIDITLKRDGTDNSLERNFQLQWADCCEKLPFASETFDHVVSLWCIEHVAKPRIMLTEMARVLKQEGKLYIVFPNYDNPLKRCPSYWCDLAEDDSVNSLRARFTVARLFRQVYRRATYFLRQWLKQALLDFSSISVFEINKDPAFKYLPWARDRDAIHIASGRSVARFLTRKGLFQVEANNNNWRSRLPLIGGFFRSEGEYRLCFVKPRSH